MRKILLRLGVVALAALIVGCDDQTTDTTSLGPPTSAGRGGIPGPNDGGSGGEDPVSFDLTFTGGLVGSNQVVPTRDNRNSLVIDGVDGTWDMTNTHAAALLELKDPADDDVCEFRPDYLPHDLKTVAVGALLESKVNGAMRVNKREGRGSVFFTAAQPDGSSWTSWGFNTQAPEVAGNDPGPAFIDDNGSGVDWNDRSGAREFHYTSGYFRVLIPDSTNPSSPGDLLCRVQDEMLAILVPSP